MLILFIIIQVCSSLVLWDKLVELRDVAMASTWGWGNPPPPPIITESLQINDN
jgi:hypothetical protein